MSSEGLIDYEILSDGTCSYCGSTAEMILMSDGDVTHASTCESCDEYNAGTRAITATEPLQDTSLRRNQVMMRLDGERLTIEVAATSARSAAQLYEIISQKLIEVEATDNSEPPYDLGIVSELDSCLQAEGSHANDPNYGGPKGFEQ